MSFHHFTKGRIILRLLFAPLDDEAHSKRILLLKKQFFTLTVESQLIKKGIKTENDRVAPDTNVPIYNRLSLSRNRRDPQKQFEIYVLPHIRFAVLRKKQFEQPIFTNDYVT